MAGTLDEHLPTTTLPSAPRGAFAARTIGEEFLAPINKIDFKAIERRYAIAHHSEIHDVENHAKVATLEGVTPSTALDTLATMVATHNGVDYMPKSRFSKLTNGRTCQAVITVLSELLQSPQLYHRRAHLRERLAGSTAQAWRVM